MYITLQSLSADLDTRVKFEIMFTKSSFLRGLYLYPRQFDKCQGRTVCPSRYTVTKFVFSIFLDGF